MLTFVHKLYGNAELLDNSVFAVVDKPIAISYRLRGTKEVRHSSLVDAGLCNLPLNTLVEYGYATKREWDVVSFSDKEGNVTEYLATRRHLSYFNAELNPKVYADSLTKDEAFGIESDMNRIIEVIKE
jgi:hypothetical protein